MLDSDYLFKKKTKADGTCRRLNELSIQHTHTHTRWNNDNDMRIVEVLYDEYALVYTNKTKDGVSEVLNNLYSKSGYVAWQQRFTQFSLDTGILPENIVILPKNEATPSYHKRAGYDWSQKNIDLEMFIISQ
uniref:Uncharacterized protein n=1 Tax=Monopterus albus TaxID=43700 RepID=A0A3Q3JLE9_MONAL